MDPIVVTCHCGRGVEVESLEVPKKPKNEGLGALKIWLRNYTLKKWGGNLWLFMVGRSIKTVLGCKIQLSKWQFHVFLFNLKCLEPPRLSTPKIKLNSSQKKMVLTWDSVELKSQKSVVRFLSCLAILGHETSSKDSRILGELDFAIEGIPQFLSIPQFPCVMARKNIDLLPNTVIYHRKLDIN